MYQIIANAKLDKKIQDFLLQFALNNFKNRSLFIFNGTGRQFCVLNKHKNLFEFDPDELMKTVFNSLDLYKIETEPKLGVFVGVNTEGGFVHEHTDGAPSGKIHTRINFLLSKPINGGMPIINGKQYIIEEDQCWINLANIWKHSSTKVSGNKPRVVLSVGALVDEREINDKFTHLF